jgi:hypothetical protein
MSGGGCAGRKKGRERKALTCGPGSPEREARLARGAALSEGERGRARLAGPVSCARVGRLGHGGVLGRTREGEDGPRVGKRSRPGWVVFGIGLGCHLGFGLAGLGLVF